MKLSLALVLCLVCSGCGLSMQNLPIGRAPSGDSYPVSAVFEDAANLPIGGRIRLGQSEVGRVESVRAKNFTAIVRMNIAASVRIPVGTTARLQLPSPLGEEYLLLRPPQRREHGTLRPGATIPLSATTRGPDVENLFAALGTMLNGSGLQQLSTIVSETNTIVGGREGEIRDLVARLNSVLGTLDAHRKQISDTLDSVDKLASYTRANQKTIDDALDKITPGIQSLLAQKDSFTTLLARVGPVAKTVRHVVGSTRTQFADLAVKIRPPLDALSAMNDELGGLLADTRRLGGNIKSAAPGDYITVNAHLDVPHAVLSLLSQGAARSGAVTAPGGAGRLLDGGTR
jgi:phospholipid/cholesterol/gamma-HCH transport system substrate-binding protein